ncbi:MAG TPA: hypothetical protein V6C82_06050 [Chroococcales cyanobacterium]|jgi:hypothetical protein
MSKKSKLILLATCTIGLLLSAQAAFSEVTPSPVPSRAPAIERARTERPVEMRRALKALKRSRRDLERAPHDYGGHRAKAIALIDQAIAEIEAGLKLEKKPQK